MEQQQQEKERIEKMNFKILLILCYTIEIIRVKQMSVIFYEQRVDILISFRFNSKI